MPRRTVCFVASVLILAACSGGSETATTTAERSDTTAPATGPTTEPSTEPAPSESTTTVAPPPTTAPRPLVDLAVLDPDTDEIVVEAVDLDAPVTFEALVDAGVAEGRWSEAEGLVHLLRVFVGELPPEQMPGVDGVISASLGGVIAAIDELEDPSPEEAAELARLRRIVSPPIDAVEALTIDATPGGPGDAVQVPSAASQEDCAAIQADAFTDSATLSGGCYRMIQADAAGARLRVFAPAWYEDTSFEAFPQAALEALVTSTELYADLATVGDIDLVFSLAASLDDAGGGVTYAEAVVAAAVDWGTATFTGTCPITMFPAAGQDFDVFRQTVAHEAWHCVQHYSGDMSSFADKVWFKEGGAAYFSNLVYPTFDFEHRWLDRFDLRSAVDPLFDLDYHTWVLWQYLGDVASPRAVADLHMEMSRSADRGRALMQQYASQLQDFTIAYVAGQVRDESGAPLPRARGFALLPELVESAEGTTVEMDADPFVLARYAVEYGQELRFLQSDATQTEGREAMVRWGDRFSIPSWTGIVPEVRSECDEGVRYAVVATTVEATHTVKLQIDDVERAECDPCLLGTWEVRLDTFAQPFNELLGGQGLGGATTFEFLGHYYLSMDENAVLREQRDELVTRTSTQGFAFDVVIDSFAEGSYTADGETLTVSDLVESFLEVTTDLGPLGIELGIDSGNASLFGGPTVEVGGVGAPDQTGGQVAYECDANLLAISSVGSEPVLLDRVDKILEPPARD